MPGREVSDFERLLIGVLRANGRMSFRAVAESLGVSERTVRRTYKKLTDAGVFKVVAVGNPFQLGFTCPTIIGISIDVAKYDTVLPALAAIPEVRFAGATTGNYDIILEALFAKTTDLYGFLRRLHAIDGVADTTSLILVSLDKADFNWEIPPRPTEDRFARVIAKVDASPGDLDLSPPASPLFDALDVGIITRLQRDGRMTFVELADELGVSEVTVARRLEELTGQGVIQIAAVPNPLSLGLNATVIGLKVDMAYLPRIMAFLRVHPNIAYAAVAAGEVDIVLVGHFHDLDDLAAFLTRELSRLGGVHRVNTSIILEIVKMTYDWGVAGPARADADGPRAGGRRKP